MVSILICDDDEQFAIRLQDAIKRALEREKIKAKIYTFLCSEEIGNEVLSTCDIAFLDIDFKGKSYNGIDIARRLREFRQDAVIVFVTNYLEYAPDGYEVQAFRYILKNEIPQKLEVNINQIFAHIRSAKSDIKIQMDGEIIDINVQDILFVEAMGHTLIFHLTPKDQKPGKQYNCYSTLTQMETELANRGFLRIHKSYLVNMVHIKKLNCSEVLLDSGTQLRVSSKTYAECKKQYLLWRGQH